MIPVRSLRISTRIFQRGANMFEKSMKRRASLDFPSGENNLVSPRTSPTESLPSSPSGLTFIRERIFLAGKREPAAAWPPLAAATFYRLITLLRPLPSSSSLLVLSLRLPRSVVSHGVGAKHGVEGRRVKTHTSHDVENTCAVRSSRPLLHPAVDGSADPPKWKTRRFERKLFDVGDSEFALGECVSPNVLFKRERDRSGSSKGFATQVVGGKDFNSLFLSLSFLIRVDRYGLAGSCKISQFLSSLLLVDGEERRITGFERRIGV